MNIKWIIVVLTALITSSCVAAPNKWAMSKKIVESSEWSSYGYSYDNDYMDEIITRCTALGFLAPHAIKIRFDKTSEEKSFLCSDILAKHPR